ncbi:hypothetical protein HMPREF9087_3416 [Enterococcus casseliflavus ATCC 12755]|uniref:Uncharacterized protein n=1 Tax=Enterococcus casseliflavus ATCC 12755 TaxID=888066 RepID=F0EPS4_ENTCA|nr:hypothetical protein HMPREF9087_3416 [Enterococcus casseliflavus ATCC 12755]
MLVMTQRNLKTEKFIEKKVIILVVEQELMTIHKIGSLRLLLSLVKKKAVNRTTSKY